MNNEAAIARILSDLRSSSPDEFDRQVRSLIERMPQPKQPLQVIPTTAATFPPTPFSRPASAAPPPVKTAAPELPYKIEQFGIFLRSTYVFMNDIDLLMQSYEDQNEWVVFHSELTSALAAYVLAHPNVVGIRGNANIKASTDYFSPLMGFRREMRFRPGTTRGALVAFVGMRPK